MIEIAVNALSWALIVAGSLFVVIGALGMVRMPDLYTRIHAASVTDTLGAGLLVCGLMLQGGLSLVTLKLVFILALMFFTGPVVTHALAQAALHEGIEPILSEDKRHGQPNDDMPGTGGLTDEQGDTGSSKAGSGDDGPGVTRNGAGNVSGEDR